MDAPFKEVPPEVAHNAVAALVSMYSHAIDVLSTRLELARRSIETLQGHLKVVREERDTAAKALAAAEEKYEKAKARLVEVADLNRGGTFATLEDIRIAIDELLRRRLHAGLAFRTVVDGKQIRVDLEQR